MAGIVARLLVHHRAVDSQRKEQVTARIVHLCTAAVTRPPWGLPLLEPAYGFQHRSGRSFRHRARYSAGARGILKWLFGFFARANGSLILRSKLLGVQF